VITVKIGDLFESTAQTWVNTVNCVGIMGKGVALGFRKRFPEMFEDYAARCERDEVRLGRPLVYRVRRESGLLPGVASPPELIVNFPTKEHWRSVSKLSAIVEGLRHLRKQHRSWGITSLAVPPLGCGHGQLDWDVVGPTLYQHLADLEIPVELYAPHGTSPEALTEDYLARPRGSLRVDESVRIAPAHVALARIVGRVEGEPLHWPVGRTMLQKIAYFATDAGVPTGLRHPGPTLPDAAQRFAAELEGWRDILDRVCDLVLRMTTRHAELAATVVFVARELDASDGPVSEQDVWNAVRDWKVRRRPPFADEEIGEAVRALNQLGWTPLRFSPGLPLPRALADAGIG
jgi:O-acetyl-ADP-ribose deacetylase (regulator of RNase III)